MMPSGGFDVQPDEVGKAAVYIAYRARQFQYAFSDLYGQVTNGFPYTGDPGLDSDVAGKLTTMLLSIAGTGMSLERKADRLAGASKSYADAEEDIDFIMARSFTPSDYRVLRSADEQDQLSPDWYNII